MTKPPLSSRADSSTGTPGGMQRERPRAPGTPRWVKVLGIILALIILLAVIAHLAGLQHGPDMHMSSASAGGALMLFSRLVPGPDLGSETRPEGGIE